MIIRSHALVFRDFQTDWYKYWAALLKQDADNLDGFELRSNKFWQNAVICQILFERNMLKPGSHGIGFGVGNERLPALFARLGAYVTATDQDHRKKKAMHWSKGELATGLKSLNRYKIAEVKDFEKYVKYYPADMTKIPSDFSGKFDFVWSNCALGHLGSIQAGLSFIEKSLSPLKAGGWAVHTTELNVLSNEDTAESGDTVIFRLRDLHNLCMKLSRKGYVCSPLKFDLGRTVDDFRISLQPQFGNDYSKIQVSGYLATQIVLIIRKKRTMWPVAAYNRYRLNRAYKHNLDEVKKYQVFNPNVKQLYLSRDTPAEKLNVIPLKKSLVVRLERGKGKSITLKYHNKSTADLYAVNGTILGSKPVLLATSGPHDRKSLFADNSWVGTGQDRPAAALYAKAGSEYKVADRIKSNEYFAFQLNLNAAKVKAGNYTERFSIVQEGVGWLDSSEIAVKIEVV